MAKTISDEYRADLLSVRQGSSKKWGTTGARNGGTEIAAIINRTRAQTVLDYGAGEGTLAEYLNQNTHAEVFQYDPCVAGCETIPRDEFDLVCSTDVLEHVEPEYISNVLDECFQHARVGVYHHISTCLTGRKLPDGRDFHILCKPHDWWQAHLGVNAMHYGFLLMESSSKLRRQRGEFKTSSSFYFEKIS